MLHSFLSITELFLYALVDYTAPLIKPKPLIATRWKLILKNHLDKIYKAVILHIIRFEAQVDNTRPKQYILNDNLPIANHASNLIVKDLQVQIDQN